MNRLRQRLPTLLARARALLRLSGGPADRLGPAEVGPAARAVERLHEGLVGDRELARAGTYGDSAHLGAYLLWWWPQTYAKVQAALDLARAIAQAPGNARILDLGAGPAPAALALLDALGGDALAVDQSAAALAEARALSEGALRTLQADLVRGLPPFERHFELIVIANALSELPAGARATLVDALPLAPEGFVVVIEPALRETGRALLELRDSLLAGGRWKAVAPCLTQRPCPALDHPRDWCTAESAWEPPPHLVQIADVLGLRADERLSFAPLVLARAAPPPPPELWRVVGVPRPEKGKRRLFVCSDEGRVPAARLDRDATAANADFDRLGRGDLVRLRGLGRKGDGLRVSKDSTVERVEAPTSTSTSNTTSTPTSISTPTTNPTSTVARPALLVIVGPTASGKTSLAIELAERLDAEIVSADSQQCYRGLDAGTAKPTAEERARARHHLLDVAEPEEQLDAARFVELADAAIADIFSRGRRAIVAGGTGLWIRALLRGLLAAPGASPELRAELRGHIEREGVPALHARLARIDPEAARGIRENDRVRIERALEVHALSGRRLSELQREHAFAEKRYEALVVHLEPPRDVLHERIARRTRGLFASGALERETQWLLDRCERLPQARKALKIIGYGEMADALSGRCTTAEAEERVAARTRQYARRQRTWFTKDAGPPAAWPPDATRLCAAAAGWYEGAE